MPKRGRRGVGSVGGNAAAPAAASRPPRAGNPSSARLAGHDAELLLGLRALLVVDENDAISVLNDLPPAWRGAAIDVRDAPTRAGLVSFALRWHGERPALLWEVPSGVVVRAGARCRLVDNGAVGRGTPLGAGRAA